MFISAASPVLSLFALSFLYRNERSSHGLNTELAVKSLSPSWPPARLGPGTQCSCDMSPGSSSLCPCPWLAQVKEEVLQEGRCVIRRYVIQTPAGWAGMAERAQLSFSWDVRGGLLLVDTQQHTFLPLTVCRNMIYNINPFLGFMWILIITMLFLWSVHSGSEVWVSERKKEKEETE